MKDFTCGQCGSPDIQKASVVYDGGTSTGSSMSAGSVGGRTALMSTSSSSQTNLAKKLSPPPRMGIMAMIGFGILTLIAGTFALNLMDEVGALSLIFAVCAGIFIFRIVTGIKHNAAYPERFAEYNRMWYCHKCGTTSVI